MSPGRMHDNELLTGSRNKVVVLEYGNPGESKWGLECSEILTREIIGSIRGVPSVGVVNLRQDERRMELTLTNVLEMAQRQKAMVVVWGEFYQVGEKIYLHSHCRIVPWQKIAVAPVSLSIKTAQGELKAEPPSLMVNFTPVEITTNSLLALRASHETSATIHSEPSETSAAVGRLSTTDGFGVLSAQSGWMKIRTWENYEGWVHYATLENQKDLNSLQAVIRFAQGALQYVSGNYETSEATLTMYLETCGKQDAANLALARILLGNARFRGGKKEFAESASSEYLKAIDLLPENAAPVNYLAVARLLKHSATRTYTPEMTDLESRLIRAVQQGNAEAATNLRILYQLAATNGFIRPPEMNAQSYTNSIARQLSLIGDIQGHLQEESHPY
jgi:hypothetical protein